MIESYTNGSNVFALLFLQLANMKWSLETIRDAAKLLLTMHDYLGANRRYRKCERYMHFFHRSMMLGEKFRAERDELSAVVESTYNNWSLCELRLCHWNECIALCQKVLRQRPNLVQAHYRQGKSHLYLRNYDESLAELKLADALAPRTPDIVDLLEMARRLWHEHMDVQKNNLRGLFQ